MKKFLLICCCFFITVKSFGQQFSQYNTGTLYGSFENPSQRTFVPDTSREYAFNFFIPNFNTNFFVTGDAQTALKTRAFSSYYNTADLKTGMGKYNHFAANANAYSIMFKVFASLSGNVELGFFTNTKSELRGVVTDESVALFNGFTNFPNNNYSNVFNDNYRLQVYNQIGFTYREQVTKRLSVGIKLSAVSGLYYKRMDITQSAISFDKPNDQATLSLQGTEYDNGSTDGESTASKLGASFRNPGAAVSIGASYTDESGFNWQGNIKDLGFIHWGSASTVANFSEDSTLVSGLSTPNREKNITDALSHITSINQVKKGFTTPTNGVIELSINRSYWLDYDDRLKFSPTLIASKALFYPDFTAALVAPVQYHACSISLTTSYNDLKLLNFGAQFMLKKDNSEFFIGSDRLFPTASFISEATKGSTPQTQTPTNIGPFTGMDFFVGVSFKFGYLIESHMNESSIPDGSKGFLGRLWDKWFHKDKSY
jgi:hypothetical protein